MMASLACTGLRLRRLSLVAAVVAASMMAGCAYPIRASIDESHSVAADGLRKVSVHSRNGRVVVTGEAQARDVSIKAVKSARGASLAEARDHAGRVGVDVRRDEAPGELRIVAKFPEPPDSARGYGADFDLIVPRDARLEIRTSNGRVEVARMDGTLRVDTTNGPIRIVDVRGEVRVETSNGGITIENTFGDVDARTSNGPIEIGVAGPGSVRAVTSNGHIAIVGGRGNTVATTSNGAVRLQLVELPPEPNVSVRSSNGSITVEVPERASAKVRMATSNGRVKAELGGARLSDLDVGRHRLSGTLNDGRGIIDIESSNGSLTLRTSAPGTPMQ